MAFRPQISPMQVITNGAMTGNITSLVTLVPKISMFSYSYSWTGSSPVGAVSVQFSNDYSIDSKGAVLNAGTWNTISFASSGSIVTSIAVSGNSGNGLIDIFQTGCYATRTIFTYTSGSGTLQAFINGKVS